MGTAYNGYVFPNSNETELKESVRSKCNEMGQERGFGSYSGDWGSKVGHPIEFTDKLFSSIEEAHDWLSGNTSKHEGFIAVKAPANGDAVAAPKKLTGKLEALDHSLQLIRRELFGTGYGSAADGVVPLSKVIVERVKAGKSQFKACGSCNSKIATAHISRIYCPVCQSADFLLTNTDKKKIERLTEKEKKTCSEMAAIKTQIKEFKLSKIKKVKNSKSGLVWVVGGASSC